MRPLALRASIFAHLLLLGGCAVQRAAPIAKISLPPDALDSAKSWAFTIVRAFPAYREDPISKYEQSEILNVERDIASIQNETDDALFIEEVALLKKDWNILVALDNTLQQESVI
jgi:hypothetical protein